ncbi:MAG: desulfoferrodoxin FeS4 iron-binding domain-containing protein [Selenomonadaceae bacterium]|nr:desulfoferrodoxin FeS4 iron-binding domain-containing protein [Selenomonadaceae bacterium]
MANKFFRCELCGNIIGLIHEGGGPLVCCGKPMTALEANTTDAAQEKHVPVPEFDKAAQKVTVKVGSAAHPMTPEHFIEWIHLQTKLGAQMRHLTPEDAPEAVFQIAPGDEPVAVFAYCNLHGLWKADI